MRFARVATLVSILLSSSPQETQNVPRRDSQAVAILQQSFAAMGATLPNDSVANGTVTITAGGAMDTGRIRILTRGITHSVEEIRAGDIDIAEIYADGLGAVRERGDTKETSGQWARSAQSGGFPIALLAAFLANPDGAVEYIGRETIAGVEAHHLRMSDTFASRPRLKGLAEFSIKDIWIDAATGHPIRLAFERRMAGGAEPWIPVEYHYSDYRNVGGVLYPFQIKKYFNGSLWAEIDIKAVNLNTGLTDSEFAIPRGEP